MGAVIGGATFGDNISPVSDTTIASATTQGAEIGAVVRSRIKYAIPAAGLAVVAYGVLGGAPTAQTGGTTGSANVPALAMAIAPAVVVGLLMARRPLLEGLITGILVAAATGLAFGLFGIEQIIWIDLERYSARGLIIDGMERGIGISIFTILLSGLVAGIEASGILKDIVDASSGRISSKR